MKDDPLKNKHVTRGVIESVCVKCFKPFEKKWRGRAHYYFAEAMDICPVCYSTPPPPTGENK